MGKNISFHRSFLKWAGNKYMVLPHLWPELPAHFSRFLEPFAGSCVVSENVALTFPDVEIITGDSNNHLIDLYKRVVLEPTHFVERLNSLFYGSAEFNIPHGNTSGQYYALRNHFNAGVSDVDLLKLGITRSEIFVYLNRHCFNGLCRFNSSGGFNVPFGSYKGPEVPSDDIFLFSNALLKATFYHGDYVSFLSTYNPRLGDVVYLDPPYVPLSGTSNFTDYSNDGGFGLEKQIELFLLAKKYSAQGAYVLVSNHDIPLTRDLYKDARVVSFEVRRFISGTGDGRKQAPELLAIFLPQTT